LVLGAHEQVVASEGFVAQTVAHVQLARGPTRANYFEDFVVLEGGPGV
jgi:hypothetical protein